MKKTCIYGFAFAALLASCTNTVKQEPLQSINVQQTYPDKEVKLSQLAKVTYVQPKAEGSDYLVKSSPADITSNTILIVERENGDVMLFDRNGTPVSKFNKQGQGPEEYTDIFKALYDEKKKEVYIGDKQKICVYTPDGQFKRLLRLPTGAILNELYNFDDNTLIANDASIAAKQAMKRINAMLNAPVQSNDEFPSGYGTSFVLISKTDGSLVKEIPVYENDEIQVGAEMQMGEMVTIVPPRWKTITPDTDGFVINSKMQDTIFQFDRSQTLHPIVIKTPSYLSISAPRSAMPYFMQTSDYNFMITTVLNKPDGYKSVLGPFEANCLMQDRNDNAIYKQKITLDDYSGKQVDLYSFTLASSTPICTIEFTISELKEALAANKLSGTLKQLAESSAEDDNSVIAIIAPN